MFETDKLSILIPSTRVEGEGGSAFTIYDVFVSVWHSDEQEASSWTVSHRYSSFLELHLQVSKQFPKQFLRVPFPDKSIFEQSTDTTVVQRRKVALQKYLQHLVDDPLLRTYDPVLSFLFLRDLETTRRRSISSRSEVFYIR